MTTLVRPTLHGRLASCSLLVPLHQTHPEQFQFFFFFQLQYERTCDRTAGSRLLTSGITWHFPVAVPKSKIYIFSQEFCPQRLPVCKWPFLAMFSLSHAFRITRFRLPSTLCETESLRLQLSVKPSAYLESRRETTMSKWLVHGISVVQVIFSYPSVIQSRLVEEKLLEVFLAVDKVFNHCILLGVGLLFVAHTASGRNRKKGNDICLADYWMMPDRDSTSYRDNSIPKQANILIITTESMFCGTPPPPPPAETYKSDCLR